MSNMVCCIKALRSQSCRRVRPSLYPNLGSSVLLMMASSTLAVGVKSLGFLLDPSPKGSLKQWCTKGLFGYYTGLGRPGQAAHSAAGVGK